MKKKSNIRKLYEEIINDYLTGKYQEMRWYESDTAYGIQDVWGMGEKLHVE